jgi:hypothetical protein
MNTDENAELTACPFCPEDESKPIVTEWGGAFYVLCAFCGLTTRYFKTVNLAIKYWNERGV